MAKRKRKPTDRPAETAADSPIVERRKSELWEGVVYQLSHNVTINARGRTLSKRPYWRAYFHDAQTGRTTSRYIGLEFRELKESDF